MSMDMTKGGTVRTLEAAEAFIRDFILELRNDPSGRMQRHSREYDLFLPWLWEEVINSGGRKAIMDRCGEVSRLYMDAAWSLVQKGYLRPGPPKITSEDQGGDYGKAYSVTLAGEAWLSESTLSATASPHA